jgi:hypothetical protein
MPNKARRQGRDEVVRPLSADKQSKQNAADWLCAPADPFDIWLREQLREAYDDVCSEPIPEDILRLVEADRAERECMRLNRLSKQRK